MIQSVGNGLKLVHCLGRYPKREQSNTYLCNPGDIVLFCHPFWYCQDRNHCIQRQQHGQ